MKIWLGLITSDKEYENVKALTDVHQHFDGICAVVHTQGGDNRVKDLLNERKGQGIVIERAFAFHHAHSMNEFLFCNNIKLGDYVFLADSTERFNVDFAREIRSFTQKCAQSGVNSVFQHSKLFCFRRWFGQQFVNGIHHGLVGALGEAAFLETIPPYMDKKSCFYSVRDEQRPKDHRYYHECYYLIDYGAKGNHLQLFYPNDRRELFFHETELAAFLAYLESNGVTTAKQLEAYLLATPMTQKLRHHLNLERPFRNFYRYFILKHSNEEILKDEDTWRII